MTVVPPPERKPRGLLIDYGGVLTTSVFEAFHAFERREGLAPSTVARLLRTDPRVRGLLIGLETGSVSEARFESEFGGLLGVSGDGLIGRLLAVRPQESVIRAVRALHDSGVRTALVSNSWGPRGYPAELLSELFDAVILSGEVALRKPDPEIYRLGANRIDLDPSECVFVDDLPANLEPAARLGMATVHHTDPERTVAELGRRFGFAPQPADPVEPADPAEPAARADPAQAR
jgi:epoxide hydrolase-like predicted phosphatase